MRKPYLLSIGVGLPLIGVWGHHYYNVRKKHRGNARLLGLHIV
jgi:hypothetical protein